MTDLTNRTNNWESSASFDVYQTVLSPGSDSSASESFPKPDEGSADVFGSKALCVPLAVEVL